MYLARFDVHGEEWVQAAAIVEAAAPGSAREREPDQQWDLVNRQLSSAARIPGSTIARRITFDPSVGLSQTIAITAAAEHESDVRGVIARLTRIERMRGGALSLPRDRDERDQWMERIGSLRLSTTSETFSVAGVQLACDFRIAHVLEDLLTDACVAGFPLSYQLHVRWSDISPESVRSARKSVLALRDLPGVRMSLVEWQENLARALGHASALCEEYLAVDTLHATRSVAQLLADRFRARYGPLGFPSPAFHFDPDSYQDALTIGVHSHDLDPFSAVALCSVAEPSEGRDRLLQWQPSTGLTHLLPRPVDVGRRSDPDHDAPADTTGLVFPAPYEGSDNVVFVSYKRQDLARVVPVIQLLQDMGMPVWYDRGIPGGAEWDEVIEGHLAHARFVLVCTSQAAIESRYVRREVKFADAVDVPLLPVLLEDVSLGHGMGMLLRQYQMLDARSPDFASRLRSAIGVLSRA